MTAQTGDDQAKGHRVPTILSTIEQLAVVDEAAYADSLLKAGLSAKRCVRILGACEHWRISIPEGSDRAEWNAAVVQAAAANLLARALIVTYPLPEHGQVVIYAMTPAGGEGLLAPVLADRLGLGRGHRVRDATYDEILGSCLPEAVVELTTETQMALGQLTMPGAEYEAVCLGLAPGLLIPIDAKPV